MKHKTLFAIALTLLLASAVTADLPQPKDPLRQPGILLQPTPAEWLAMYRYTPQQLLQVLLQHVKRMETHKGALTVDSASAEDKRAQDRRLYALRRLGDIASTDSVPGIEQFIAQRTAQNDWLTEYDVALARLTIERIQLRAQGEEVYVAALIDWVRYGYNERHYPGAINSKGGTTALGRARVREGARALGVLKVAEAVPVLIERHRGHNTYTGYFFIRALAQIGDARAMGLIARETSAAVGSGARIQIPLEPGEVDPAWAYWQMRTRGMNLAQTIEVLIGTLGDYSQPFGSFGVLEVIGEPAIPALIRALESPQAKDPELLQCNAARLLGLLKAKEAVPLLRTVLREGSQRVVNAAVEALGRIGDPVALPDLLEMAQSSDFYVQMAAIFALGSMGDARAEPALLKLLSEHPNDNVRFAAAEALAKVGTPAAIPVLEQRLQAESLRSVRGRINWALRMLRQKAR